MKLPLPVPNNFRIIAHRGASGYAPENTLAAFQLAEKMGAEEIELDVWLSRDNHIVICHDGRLDRYGYPGLHVKDMDLKDLLSLDMGTWFSPFLFSGERMLTLKTLFTQFGDRFIYHVEIKEPQPGLLQKVLDRVAAQGLERYVFITSKHFHCLVEAKSSLLKIGTAWLLTKGHFTKKNIEQAAGAGLIQICPHAQDTTTAEVQAGHAKGLEVRAWGISTIDLALQAIDSECDGFTINWPDWFIHDTAR